MQDLKQLHRLPAKSYAEFVARIAADMTHTFQHNRSQHNSTQFVGALGHSPKQRCEHAPCETMWGCVDDTREQRPERVHAVHMRLESRRAWCATATLL
jgi:hypothetical protein